MSQTLEYFFNYPKPLSELAEDVNNCLGCSLSPYENDPEDLFDRFLSMEFSLHTADGYENDRELDFENFHYQLSFRTPWPDADAHPIRLPAMLIVAYALHRKYGIVGMLVSNMQRLLTRYEERAIPEFGNRLFDVVSDTPFINFEAHLQTVSKRCYD